MRRLRHYPNLLLEAVNVVVVIPHGLRIIERGPWVAGLRSVSVNEERNVRKLTARERQRSQAVFPPLWPVNLVPHQGQCFLRRSPSHFCSALSFILWRRRRSCPKLISFRSSWTMKTSLDARARTGASTSKSPSRLFPSAPSSSPGRAPFLDGSCATFARMPKCTSFAMAKQRPLQRVLPRRLSSRLALR